MEWYDHLPWLCVCAGNKSIRCEISQGIKVLTLRCKRRRDPGEVNVQRRFKEIQTFPEASGHQAENGAILWIGRAILPLSLQNDLRHAFDCKTAPLLQRPLQSINSDLISRITPCGILSTLMWSSGDVLDAARVLSAVGYRGPYRALTPPLPNASLIVAEVAASWPNVDFNVLELGERHLRCTPFA
ncbi:hypothetical protein [Tropicimonas sp. IMCC34043]|uniref:hypothetical protein n=1 Tax=Tropicimonas sp. IMCC34043 TaxID=2248760 RepID=UPI0013009779|nr:hypothetical protein [Tropicimonas sp. IMCC34043]